MKKPLLICLTPVRNEAWILHAFLKATSLWADYIIIADQGSTDSTREILLSYPKVILIDNPLLEMNQAQSRGLLFDEAHKIKEQKIIFSLDADEFLSGDFMHTVGWSKILDSKPGDIFWFKWINLVSTNKYIPSEKWMYWACHYDNSIESGDFPNNYIHEWRLPYPQIKMNEYFIDDISFIHFARISKARQLNKERFYQVITKCKEPSKSIISLYRMYHADKVEKEYSIDNSIYTFYNSNGISLINEIDFSDSGNYYTNQVLTYIEEKGLKYFVGLDIWDKDFLFKYQLSDPRNRFVKLLHLYLEFTQKFSHLIIIRIFDKFIRYILQSFKYT